MNLKYPGLLLEGLTRLQSKILRRPRFPRRPGCAGDLKARPVALLEVKLMGWGDWEVGAVTFAKV